MALLTELSKNSYPKDRASLPSRYGFTPIFFDDDTESYLIGTWEAKSLSPDPTDQLYILEEDEVGRPDLVSYRFYKTPRLYWFVLHINDIIDPYEEMYAGMVLRIPALQRVMTSRVVPR